MNTDKIYAESIAKNYAPKDTSKVIALKKLDAHAKTPAKVFGYGFGTAATLVFGTGMCLAMKVIGSGSTGMMILGILIGLLGMFGMAINPMICDRLLENGKKKYAADILRLAREIVERES